MFRSSCGVRARGVAAASLAAIVAASLAHGQTIRLGQMDTFGPDNPENWSNGGPTPDPLTPTGGPGGSSDHYLRISADGSGVGGRITAFNRNQWVGNYLAGGVTELSMDLRNFSATTLQVRLAFKQVAGFGSPGYSSTVPFTIANDGQWHRAVFSLAESAFTPISEPEPFASVMSGMFLGEVRILHATSPSLTGSNVNGALGVDNITAVPAPGAAGVLLLGAALARRRRR